MKELDLTKYGIKGATVIAHNPSYEYLFAEETKPELTGYAKGQNTELDAVNVFAERQIHRDGQELEGHRLVDHRGLQE